MAIGRCWVFVAAVMAFVAVPSPAQEVVVEDDEPAVVISVEEETVAADEAPADAWPPTMVEPRTVDGQVCFSRQSSDAFVDPDQRLALEAKYCFDLSSLEMPKLGNLVRAKDATSVLNIVSADADGLGAFGQRLPISIAPASEASDLGIEWLDYESRKPPVLLVALVGQGEDGAVLQVVRGKQEGQSFAVSKALAERSIEADQLPAGLPLSNALATWDRPASLGAGVNFFGRVIALIKQADGRYAIDFAGEALHADSDCRLWLGPIDHEWGKPIGVRFVEIPILKEGGQIVATPVAAVIFANAAGERRTVGFDFPICASPALVQLRKLSAGLASGEGAKTSTPPDLAKLLGEDTVDELSRRLVDGQYR